nr:Mu transposase C-terminal domain-containing protein [uncultured Cetobacterium sp.]
MKDIEKETQISYATLKRWVSQYKHLGVDGLEKKQRMDKNSFKKVNEEALSHLKILYKEYHNLPITKLYDKAKATLINCNSMISYPTFFRIINNLDENIRENSVKLVKKDKLYEYGIIQKAIPIPFFNNRNEIYYLTVYYNRENYKISNFIFEEKPRNLIKLFNFIRESIIMEGEYPKNISLDTKIDGITKTILRKVYFESGINLIQEEPSKEIIKYLGYVDTDILKEFYLEKPKKIEDISVFLKKYLFVSQEKRKQNIKLERKMNCFLTWYRRKVYNCGVRVKNSIYNGCILKELEGDIVDVAYSEFSVEKIDIYREKIFIGEAKIIK